MRSVLINVPDAGGRRISSAHPVRHMQGISQPAKRTKPRSVNQIQIDSESEKQSNPPITTVCHDAKQPRFIQAQTNWR